MLRDVSVNYSVAWERDAATPEAAEARRALAELLAAPRNQAAQALRDLLKVASPAPAPLEPFSNPARPGPF